MNSKAKLEIYKQNKLWIQKLALLDPGFPLAALRVVQAGRTTIREINMKQKIKRVRNIQRVLT